MALQDQLLTTSNGNLSIPVIAGFAVGVFFIILFASFMNINGNSQPHFIGKYPFIKLSVSGLKDSYSMREPLNFILSAMGYGANCIESPEILISNSYRVLVWSYQTFNLMGCGDPDLSYPHKIADTWSTERLDEPLYLNQSGTYTMIATYYGETIEKRFNINSPDTAATSPYLDADGNIDCEKYSEPAAEPGLCLFGRVPVMALNIAGNNIYYGDNGSFCAPAVCVDTVLIVPEKLIRIEKGTEIEFETIGFRQPEQVDVSLWKGVNRPVFGDLQLKQSTDDNSKFTVDLPDGDYILQLGVQWMKSEYSEMSATYYYKIRVS